VDVVVFDHPGDPGDDVLESGHCELEPARCTVLIVEAERTLGLEPARAFGQRHAGQLQAPAGLPPALRRLGRRTAGQRWRAGEDDIGAQIDGLVAADEFVQRRDRSLRHGERHVVGALARDPCRIRAQVSLETLRTAGDLGRR